MNTQTRISSLLSRKAFTLVELLVVMALIAVLAGLTMGVYGVVQDNARRSRSKTEIAAISAALERYKTDNGLYPLYALNGSGLPDPLTSLDPTTDLYLTTSRGVYSNLAGRVNYSDLPTGPVYMEFKLNQVSGVTSTAAYDPWKHAYGYFYTTNTAQTTSGYNGVGFFDLWSVGDLNNKSGTNQWITNWRSN